MGQWRVNSGSLMQYFPDGIGDLVLSGGDVALDVPEGVAPGNCKVVDGALVAMAEGEKLNSNPFWADLRADRNARIAITDWRMLSDYPGGDAAAWITYRAALRNVPQNTTDPASPSWPEEP